MLCAAGGSSTSTRTSTLSHILDFGPGGSGGAAAFTASLTEGTGIAVVLASLAHVRDVERNVDRPAMLGMKWALAASEEEHGPLPHASNWGLDYMPRAVERYPFLSFFLSYRYIFLSFFLPYRYLFFLFFLTGIYIFLSFFLTVIYFLPERRKDRAMLLETKFSKLTGKPPVMIAGMTPTTSEKGTLNPSTLNP